MFCSASPEILKRQMLLSNGTRCQMIRLLVPCRYSRHGGQCQNSWATVGSGISYISCTPISCAKAIELLRAPCLTASVMTSSLAGGLYSLWALSIYKHILVLQRCYFSCWNWLISGCLQGWCSENTCAWWHILLCIFHDHLITAEACWGGLCVLENMWKHSLLWWQHCWEVCYPR